MRAMRNERIALVTGAGRGIGRAIALALAGECRAVAVHYHRDRAAAEATAKAVRAEGAECVVVRADLTREGEAIRLVRGVEKNSAGSTSSSTPSGPS